MRDPDATTRHICEELLGTAWVPVMAQPYTTSAVDSFQAARLFATTDPKLLRQKTIEPALADKWRSVLPPSALNPVIDALARTFDYVLHP